MLYEDFKGKLGSKTKSDRHLMQYEDFKGMLGSEFRPSSVAGTISDFVVDSNAIQNKGKCAIRC